MRLHLFTLSMYLLVCMCPATIFAHPLTPATSQAKPLAFIENSGQLTDQHGQARHDIDVKLETPGMNIFVGDGAIHYQWVKASGNTPGKKELFARHRQPAAGNEPTNTQTETYRLDVELIGANKNAEIIKDGQLNYNEQYYLPQCPDGVSAQSYTRIVYKNIYPHIDWVVYSKDNALKYDFVVYPGGNTANIKLHYKGATTLALKDGSLVATTPFGSITENVPYSYDAATKKEIPSGFILQNGIVKFNVAQTTSGALVIDPVLRWATYFGGAGAEEDVSVATDTAGNAYLTGWTSSLTNIATTGAYQQIMTGSPDGYIVKFDKAGVCVWATYYGGAADEYFKDVFCSVTGDIYAAGVTWSSTGIATSGAHQPVWSGTADGMLVKFNALGQRVWATYYGGTGAEFVNAVTGDYQGNIFIAGGTSSSNGIASPGSFQVTPSGSYIAKFNSAGQRLWGTYYVNSTSDPSAGFTSLACDGPGNVYAVEGLNTTPGFATPGSHQPTAGGANEGGLVKFSAGGTRLWATYYGGAQDDKISAVAADVAGNVYVAGFSSSTNNIASSGSFQPAISGIIDGFIARFNATGVRQWGTYFGGNNVDYITDLAMGQDGNIYMVGHSLSAGLATPGAYQITNSPSTYDVTFGVFNPFGQRLYTTYFGGITAEYGNEIACSSKGKIYLAMEVGSGGLATPGSYQTSFGGYNDAFLVQFDADTAVFLVQPQNNMQYCGGDSIPVTYGVTQPFNTANTFTIQLSDASGSFASPVNIGSANAQNGGVIKVYIPVSIPNGTGYRMRIVSTSPAYISTDNSIDITLFPTPANVVAGNDGPLCAGATIHFTATTSSTGVSWYWTGPNGFISTLQNPSFITAPADSGNYILHASIGSCSASDTTLAVINKTSTIGAYISPNDTICAGLLATFVAVPFNAGSAPQYQWFKNGSLIPGATSTVYNTATLVDGDSLYCRMIATGVCIVPLTLYTNGIKISVQSVVVVPAVTISSTPSQPIPGQPVIFNATQINGGPSPAYQWLRNGVSVPGAIYANWNTTGLHPYDKISCVLISNDHCAQPLADTSNEIVVNFPVGIDNPAIGNTLNLYPNPNNGTFTIAPGQQFYNKNITAEITNAIGQTIYNEIFTAKQSKQITLPTGTASGIYQLKLRSKENTKVITFTLYH